MYSKELTQFKKIIEGFSKRKIAVIGDMAADVYIYGKPHRLSREAPVIVVKYNGEKIVPGSAANTVANLLSLGVKVYPIGIIGNDSAGKTLLRYFSSTMVKKEGFFIDRKRETITKTRIMAGDVHTSRQQIIRIDKEPPLSLSPWMERKVLNYLNKIEKEIEALLVSDYGYELITPKLVERIRQIAKEKIVVVDSHHRIKEFKGITAITPNETEAEEASGLKIEKEVDVIKVGEKLLAEIEPQAVLITRGNEGMMLFERGKDPQKIPISGRDEVTDVTGAGDTVASVFILSLQAGASFLEAAKLSNYAAGVVVMKSGTAILTREGLIKALETS